MSARRQSGGWAAEPPRPRRGFTLLEVVLALAILVLMMGIAVVNFGAMRGSHSLEEGALRIETAMRMARADAATKGRRLRIAFGEADGRAAVLWEPDPLAAPGEFVECTACTWRDYLHVEGVVIDRCEYVGASAYRAMDEATAGGAAADTGMAVITFEPDGSSDSVRIELAATDAPETRRAVVELEGLTGTVTSRVLTLEELQAY